MEGSAELRRYFHLLIYADGCGIVEISQDLRSRKGRLNFSQRSRPTNPYSVCNWDRKRSMLFSSLCLLEVLMFSQRASLLILSNRGFVFWELGLRLLKPGRQFLRISLPCFPFR